MTAPRRDSATHLIGLLLGTENDWPTAFETLVRRLGPDQLPRRPTTTSTPSGSPSSRSTCVTPVRHDVVIDRLAWWYYHPREWLKKAALVNDTYLLNNPFTFQAMEKHSAYCAMIRLGFDIPDTVLVPYKNPVDHEKWAYTAETYNLPFDLDEVAVRVGYPMFMKPFDGGAWRGVSRVDDVAALHKAYNESGQMLMHLQAAADVRLVRPVADHRPGNQDHAVPAGTADARPVRGVARLPAARGRAWRSSPCPGRSTRSSAGSSTPASRWSPGPACGRSTTPTPARTSRSPRCTTTSRGRSPNWCRWSVFCAVTGRKPQVDTNTRAWFDVADDPDLNWADKLGRYALMSDQYFEADTYREFCSTALASLPEIVYEWITSAEFDALLVDTVRATYPPHEQERFLAHFRGLIGLWVADQT